jgi:hippurate hydrolase
MYINKRIQEISPRLVEWRHKLHSYPETAFHEFRTSDFITEKLKSFDLTIDRSFAKTGVVASLKKGRKSGKKIALRADIDGLDIHEENSFEYRSKNKGKMHACGHDGHTAILLGAAYILSRYTNFNGTVIFIFQPAEENEGGALRMVKEGLFEKYPVEAVFGLHNFPSLPVGSFATRPGPFMAAFDIFEIVLTGNGGHAAMPHFSKDPIIAVSHIINQFQSIVSREINPIEPAVISVTEIHGGTSYNLIPKKVQLRGTTRHFTPNIQSIIENRMNEIVCGISKSMGINAKLNYEKRYPAVVNSINETLEAIKAAKMTVGTEKIINNLDPIMGSEDFGFMLKEKAGNYITIGSGKPEPGGMLHQTKYDFNDELLPIGVQYWENLVLNFLKNPI